MYQAFFLCADIPTCKGILSHIHANQQCVCTLNKPLISGRLKCSPFNSLNSFQFLI